MPKAKRPPKLSRAEFKIGPDHFTVQILKNSRRPVGYAIAAYKNGESQPEGGYADTKADAEKMFQNLCGVFARRAADYEDPGEAALRNAENLEATAIDNQRGRHW